MRNLFPANFLGNQTELSKLMGTKNLLMLKTHFHSINTRSVNDFVYGNMLWALASLRVFICNYVLYSFGLILKYIFRIQIGDRKNELSVQIEDSQTDGFGQELVNFLFQSSEDVVVYEGSEERESEIEIESSASMESLNDVPENGIEEGGGSEKSVSEKTDSDMSGNSKRSEGDAEGSVFMETDSNVREGETESSVSMKTESDFHEDCHQRNQEEERKGSVLMDGGSDVHEDNKKRKEEETESSVLVDSNVQEDNKRTESSVSMEDEESKTREEEEEEEIEDPVLITSKYQYVSGRDISGYIEEPTIMTFSFREFYVGPYVSDTTISELKSEKHTVQEEDSAQEQCLQKSHESPCVAATGISAIKSEYNIVVQEEEEEESIQEQSPNVPETENSELKSEEEPVLQKEGKEESVQEQNSPKFNASPNVSETEISELKSEEEPVLQEEGKEESVQEQRIFHGHSTSDQFSLKSDLFGESDSSDEDDLDFNDNYFASDSESESSSSSGLIWANSNKTDDLSITYEFLAYQNALEGFEPECFKMMKKLGAEDEYIELEPSEKNLNTWGTDYFSGKAMGEDQNKDSNNEEEKLGELDSDEEDDFEWEEDDLEEQIKMELRNARQGGLSTILEEEEEEEEEGETKSPNMVEDLKPLKIEEKHEYKDQISEIKKVHRSYEEKMRKLDILNYQTMHALGLLQLKDPEAKPVISQNLWPRKALKNSSEPLATFVKELNRELEVVYVGQVCLSWEILCWEHRKAQELKQYDSEWSRQYNMVAGEFQLLQVLMQRFIENESFQGPRIQNYVKNRCVIRNLLQVPAIKDDSMKDKKMMKREEEDAVSSGKLAETIKESMRVFWEFVRADKDDKASALFKVSHHQSKKHLKDPAISDLLRDIRTHLQKKEKRLKDIVRSGNCIVRKFQKQSEKQVEVDHEQLVAQVEMKLIGRVLNLSKLRKEQLIWCNEKLKRITFVNRNIQVEPSFLLFPF